MVEDTPSVSFIAWMTSLICVWVMFSRHVLKHQLMLHPALRAYMLPPWQANFTALARLDLEQTQWMPRKHRGQERVANPVRVPSVAQKTPSPVASKVNGRWSLQYGTTRTSKTSSSTTGSSKILPLTYLSESSNHEGLLKYRRVIQVSSCDFRFGVLKKIYCKHVIVALLQVVSGPQA